MTADMSFDRGAPNPLPDIASRLSYSKGASSNLAPGLYRLSKKASDKTTAFPPLALLLSRAHLCLEPVPTDG